MDLSNKITGLSEVIKCPVGQDIYRGSEKRYITFTYEDELPVLNGNNTPVADTAYIQVSYYVPKDYKYMDDKHKIRDYLEEQGFKVTSIRCWMEDARTGYQNIRHLLFETNYTETRRKKEG